MFNTVSAHAAIGDSTDSNYLGELTVTPTSGNSTDTPPFTQLSAQRADGTGCPDGYRTWSRVVLLNPATGSFNSIATIRSTTGNTTGLNGSAIVLTGNYAATTSRALNDRAAWTEVSVGASAKVLLTCEATYDPNTGALTPLDSALYFAATIQKDTDTTWKIVSGTSTEKTPTTTTVASSNVAQTSATLTATVSPAEATGTVTFTSGSITATGTVTDGVATADVPGLTAGTEYTFTAAYPGDDAYAASDNTVTFTTLAAEEPTTPSDSNDTNIKVNVPEVGGTTVAGGLTISLAPGVSTLTGGARSEGQAWEATGQLGSVTVNDDRRDASADAWTLSGTASDFTGAGTISASALSWTPSKESGAGEAGSASSDLSKSSPLATGAASADTNVTTTVNAGLKLVVPSDSAAGNYSSKLTLILI